MQGGQRWGRTRHITRDVLGVGGEVFAEGISKIKQEECGNTV